MASGEFPRADSGLVSSSAAELEKRLIDKELEENGVQVDMDTRGQAILKFIDFQMEVSRRVARGRFVVSEKCCQPFGVLHGGATAFIAESIVSTAGGFASGKRIAGIELNVNHLRAVPVGCKVTVIAKPLQYGNRIQVWEVKFEAENPKNSTVESNTDLPELFLAAAARVTLIVGLPQDPAFKEPSTQSKM